MSKLDKAIFVISFLGAFYIMQLSVSPVEAFFSVLAMVIGIASGLVAIAKLRDMLYGEDNSCK